MKTLMLAALAASTLLASSDSEIAAYIRAFEQSLPPGPDDSAKFLAGRLSPNEQKKTDLLIDENPLRGVNKPSEILHRRALIFIPGATLATLRGFARDYNGQHKLYPSVLKHSSLCSLNGPQFTFRYWTTKYQGTIAANVATHQESGPRYMVMSRLTAIRNVNGDDDRKSAADPELDLCKLPLDPESRNYVKDIRTVWRFEESSGGVYVETNNVAVIKAPFLIKFIAEPLVRSALMFLNDEVLREMARNPSGVH